MIAIILPALAQSPPLDPPAGFAETLELRREPLSVGKCVSECPLCGCEIMECDCQWSAQA